MTCISRRRRGHVRHVVVAGSTAVVLAACTASGSKPAATALQATNRPASVGSSATPSLAPTGLLWAKTATGVIALDVATGQQHMAVPNALPSPDWSTLVAVRPDASGSTVVAIDPATGHEHGAQHLAGLWEVKTVSPSGRRAALARPGTTTIGTIPQSRATTDLAVVTLDAPADAQILHLSGNFLPEAFSIDGQGLFLIEYLPALHPDRYRIRRLELGSGAIDPVFTRDKQPAEEMHAQSRTQTYDPGATTLYTLYAEAGVTGHAFIHTLSLHDGWVVCLDLPATLGFNAPGTSPSGGAIAVSPDGATLYVAGPNGQVAIVDTNTLTIRGTVTLRPRPARSATEAPFAAAGPGFVWVTRGSQAERVDARSLAVSAPITLPTGATGLATTADGTGLLVTGPSRLLALDAGSGRVTTDLVAPALAGGAAIGRLHAG
jgi:hypothetical protein